MKIAILSDSHDNWSNLEKAVEKANQEKCKVLLFAGDLIAPPGVDILAKFKGEVKFIWGNNEGEKVGIIRKIDAAKNIEFCGEVFGGMIGGLRVFMSHQPKYADLALKSGDYELSIHGHTHQYRQKKDAGRLLIAPGEIQGYKTNKASFVIFDTKSKKSKKILIN